MMKELMATNKKNFRRQYKELYPTRRPLVLAVENECKVQKFVSTSIRPTTFIEFPELIDNWQACASFIADHIEYEPLENPTKIPTRLHSPDLVLKSRKGNSFEMATLLCSILIGLGFPALVVSGYATREVTTNDQRRVKCPYIPEKVIEPIFKEELDPKYRLKDPPFLKSHFLMQCEKKKLDAENAILEEKKRQEMLKLEEFERPPPDPENGYRTHAWIAMIKNAPWCYKAEFKIEQKDDEEEISNEPMAFFIEPSTGFVHKLTDPCYQGIESIWNHQNYYVNRQYGKVSIAEMKLDLSDTESWEHFLPGEPFELRKEKVPNEDEEEDETPAEDQALAIEKHLDMPTSWVEMLHVSAVDFEERYVGGEKKENYKYCIYEKYAPYKNTDGLMKRLTIYKTLEYEEPLNVYEWYENRDDFMVKVHRNLIIDEITEEFEKGRNDCLKVFIYNVDENEKIVMKFYSKSRFDCLKEVVYHSNYIEEKYDENRRDLIYYRKFFISDSGSTLITRNIEKIVEKFNRNEKKDAYHDVAIRHFNRSENQVFVQFHYASDAITATTKTFIKPPRSEKEAKFDPSTIEGYIANPWAKQMNDLELYYLLQELMKDEEKSVDCFHARDTEIKEILQIRRQQIAKPLLKFSIFDPLRNESARKMRLQKFEQMKTREMLAKSQQADFLAPYLVRFEDKKPERDEIDVAIQDCLRDFRKNYEDMINELQHRHDEATAELNSLKRFLNRYMDQFSVQEYEKFIQEGENIERYRKIIHQRIIAVKEESNRKYGNLVESIPGRLKQISENKGVSLAYGDSCED
ncbi:hypothetical protein PVAND_002087 [Polypedilum vanderplanki]|uniref:Dynein regulatory complex subunit 7 n=1 Tax=Polypedilum vanderplanki TaxID=319348 RepID=A0A9J6BQ87_POLVA|nr:hypothetical protein PVAND_002087 [Polypedilum vanderplanki]